MSPRGERATGHGIEHPFFFFLCLEEDASFIDAFAEGFMDRAMLNLVRAAVVLEDMAATTGAEGRGLGTNGAGRCSWCHDEMNRPVIVTYWWSFALAGWQ